VSTTLFCTISLHMRTLVSSEPQKFGFEGWIGMDALEEGWMMLFDGIGNTG